MNAPRKDISPERQIAYIVGGVISAIGVILFLSNFVFTATDSGGPVGGGNSDGIEGLIALSEFQNRGQMMAARAVGGIFLTVIGGVVRQIAKSGIAGSGIVLDPEQTRKDMEPWSRMKGGMLQDAMEEVEVIQDLKEAVRPTVPVIKICCQKCSALNDEKAKFCNQCAEPL